MARSQGASLKVPTKPKSRAPKSATPQIQHRIGDVAMHISWYGFRTQARLARDSAASEAAISRLIRGHSTPSLGLALRLATALERRLQKSLPLQELFSLDGNYPTASVCDLCDCRGCLPPRAYTADDCLRPDYTKNLSV